MYAGKPIATYSVLEAITIPLPAKPGIAPLHMREQFARGNVQLDVFADFVYNGVSLVNKYYNNPVSALANPRACNDYNSVCQYLPFCSQETEDRQVIFDSEMITREWNPVGVV